VAIDRHRNIVWGYFNRDWRMLTIAKGNQPRSVIPAHAGIQARAKTPGAGGWRLIITSTSCGIILIQTLDADNRKRQPDRSEGGTQASWCVAFDWTECREYGFANVPVRSHRIAFPSGA